MQIKIIAFVTCLALIQSLSCTNIFNDFISDIKTAKNDFDNFLSYSDKREESSEAIGYLLKSLIKVGEKLEAAALENTRIAIKGNVDDLKIAAVACTKYAQLLGDLESLEPIFKNSKQYSQAITIFMKNKRDVDDLFYKPFMAAFHINSLNSWTKFQRIYERSHLNQTVTSIFDNQVDVFKLLLEPSCDKYEIGKYCGFTISELYKVLSMRGAASAVENDDNIDNINIDFYSLLSSCNKAVNAC